MARSLKALPGRLCWFGLVVVMCSCTPVRPHRRDIQRDPRFPDVVVPTDFELVESQFASSESSGHRNLIMRYTGKMSSAGLYDFVLDKYSIGGWKLEHSQALGKRTFMDFAKRQQRCRILIEQHRFSTSITIRVYEIAE